MSPDKTKDFLLEIGTEELPPAQVSGLASSLSLNLEHELKKPALTYDSIKPYSSPRRLAILISNLSGKQPDQALEIRGPRVEIAFDKSGQPTAAAIKFAGLCGVDIPQLGRLEDKKGDLLFHKTIKPGQTTLSLLPEIIINCIKKLQIKRPMRWGENKGPFIRPVHWLVALFGRDIIPLEIFEIKASNQTFGHRFHHPGAIKISEPKQYENLLAEKGFVIADADKRQQKIRAQIIAATKFGDAIIPENLLTEVTNLVEWPVALTGSFDQRFLELPKEVLITTLKNHQRYFPIIDNSGNLLPSFIIISNIESKNPKQVVEGNERVIQARFDDAEYFYRNDLRHDFASLLGKLKTITFQEKLGTLYDKTIRLKTLSIFIASKINASVINAKRAAELSKCDLATSMVWEFPELQGIMGYYYAGNLENKEVATAIKEQYLPRFSKDEIPESALGCVLALSDRVDSLVGLFGINKAPSGDTDPFGLRRMAAGILRIILEKNLNLDLKELLETSCLAYKNTFKNTDEIVAKALDFIYERLRHLYIEQGKSSNVFRAVLSKTPTNLQDFTQRFDAVTSFSQLPESEDLIEIYKRIRNILDKAKYSSAADFNLKLATEEAEKNMVAMVTNETKIITELFQNKEYHLVLKELVKLKEPISAFFEVVIVMSEEEKIRLNRLALLKNMRDLFELIADLSYLVSGNTRVC